MIDPLTLISDGGYFQWLILLLGIAGLPVALVVAILNTRLWIPTAGYMVIPAAVVSLGVLGTDMGYDMMRLVLPKTSEHVRPILAANGMAVGLYTTIFASLFASGILFLSAGLSAVSLAIRWKTTDGEEAKEASARTELLGGIALLAATAIATLGWALWLNYRAFYWSAFAKAAVELRATMMATALQNGSSVFLVAAILFVVSSLAGIAAVTLRRESLTRGGIASLVVSGVLASAIIIVPGVTQLGLGDLHEITYEVEDGKLPGMPNAPDR
jgi:hypothetical protein